MLSCVKRIKIDHGPLYRKWNARLRALLGAEKGRESVAPPFRAGNELPAASRRRVDASHDANGSLSPQQRRGDRFWHVADIFNVT